MNSLELFCGTKSFTKEAKKHGIECTTLDINHIFNPDICKDILNTDPKELGKFNILWASPPCQCFSVMSMARHWKETEKGYEPKDNETIKSINILRKTIEIISIMKPDYWFIENPRGMMRIIIDDILKEFNINEYQKKSVTYCKYGLNIMKPTDIYTNLMAWKPIKPCNSGDNCHENTSKYDKRRTGTMALKDKIERARVPEKLCNEIIRKVIYESTKIH